VFNDKLPDQEPVLSDFIFGVWEKIEKERRVKQRQ